MEADVRPPKAPAVAPVNKRIASQQGCRTGGLEAASLEVWRAGWPARFAKL